MKKSIYAVFDRKTHSVELVKEFDNLAAFQRWFATVFLRSDSMFALYPDDYDVYEICRFNTESLVIDKDATSKLLFNISELFDIFKIPRPSLIQPNE